MSNQIHISVSEAHNRLSRWLNKVEDGPVTITRWGKPVGVIISPKSAVKVKSEIRAEKEP